jgi:type IV pilus assembly protein PilF
MNQSALARLLPLLVPGLLLAACTDGAVRDGDATGDLSAVGKESPGNLYVNLAVEYLRQGQIETALQKAKKALSEDSANAQAHNVIALIYQRLGQAQLAEKHFLTAVGLQPEDPYILNAYASFLCDRRKFADAESQYKKAIANPLYPRPWVAMTNMGTCSRRSGDRSKAETYYRQALGRRPTFAPAVAGLAELDYERGRYKSAKAHLDSYFRVAQPTPQVLLLAVKVERKLGSRKRADTYAQLLRKTYPSSREASQL